MPQWAASWSAAAEEEEAKLTLCAQRRPDKHSSAAWYKYIWFFYIYFAWGRFYLQRRALIFTNSHDKQTLFFPPFSPTICPPSLDGCSKLAACLRATWVLDKQTTLASSRGTPISRHSITHNIIWDAFLPPTYRRKVASGGALFCVGRQRACVVANLAQCSLLFVRARNLFLVPFSRSLSFGLQHTLHAEPCSLRYSNFNLTISNFRTHTHTLVYTIQLARSSYNS